MIQTASCQRLRNELKTIRAGLEEVMEMLSTEPLAKSNEQVFSDFEDQTGVDFFDEIIHPVELPEDEALFRRVLALITELGYASTIVLQHRLEVNYRQAAGIIAELERAGLIGPAHGFRPHKVLPAAYSLLERLGEDHFANAGK
ncbi:MAG TPA: DNA translocase FtsK [Blastocatellia bacterium]|nr:DNA translocase FtsK [Blastocatellia bacterium]